MSMQERKRFPGRRSGVLHLIALVTLSSIAACSLGTEESARPDNARVVVTVDSPNPLTLITSTDFFESIDDVSGQIVTHFNRADTVLIDSSFDETFQLGSQSSFVARLIETENTAATIEMRVFLDGELEWERTGTMRDATLEYKFVFTGRRL